MRQLFLLVVATLSTAMVMAQGVIVVDSEKIFKSQDDYTAALAQVDVLAKSYQEVVDARYEDVESLFNQYATVQASYTDAMRQQVESAILAREKEASNLQEEYFGTDGTLMKRRMELIEPIQKRVFAAIDAYAKSKGADVVLDSASNPSMLYVRDGVEATDEIIKMLTK